MSFAAAVLAVAALLGRGVLSRAIARPRVAALALALAAAALSVAWVVVYLRGGPRIIDATAYYLSGRAISEGMSSWPVSEPPAATMGRFLVRDTAADGANVAVIFPPGFPIVLALGFLAGAPMAVGPALAVLVTLATYDLTRTAARVAGIDDGALLALGAAALSVVCGAMRYHTADTMSHGLAAVCVAAALGAALRLREASSWRWAVVLGAVVGLAIATRPVSGLALAGLSLFAWGRGVRVSAALAALVGAAPGLALLVWHQRAATGELFASSQALYYAAADGPAGCFRYGLGAEIGCRFEHGDFVDANLARGYGLVEALGTTGRRLKMHGVDALNAEPLAIAIGLPALALALRRPALRALGMALPVFVLAYAPFYFDGNYPGGGARFFADVLPVEHAVIALAIPAIAGFVRARWAAMTGLDTVRATLGLVALSLVGFSLRAQADHASLRDREGGRPMFRPAEVKPDAGGVLVFVNTDHGFLLGFDPQARADHGEIEVARLRGDANDTWLWEARGKPPSVRHRFDVRTGFVVVDAFVPTERRRLAAESFWPALRQARGYAVPAWGAGACGDARVLRLVPDAAGTVEVDLAVPSAVGERSLRATFATDAGATIRIALSSAGGERTEATLSAAAPCSTTEAIVAPTGVDRLRVTAEPSVDLVAITVDAGASAQGAKGGENH